MPLMYLPFAALGFAFSKLTDLSDDDLRTMIQDAEEELESVS